MKTLDLNCDMGEGFGAWTMGDDAALLDSRDVGQHRLRFSTPAIPAPSIAR